MKSLKNGILYDTEKSTLLFTVKERGGSKYNAEASLYKMPVCVEGVSCEAYFEVSTLYSRDLFGINGLTLKREIKPLCPENAKDWLEDAYKYDKEALSVYEEEFEVVFGDTREGKENAALTAVSYELCGDCNKTDILVSSLDSCGIDRSIAIKAHVDDFDLEALEEAFEEIEGRISEK